MTLLSTLRDSWEGGVERSPVLYLNPNSPALSSIIQCMLSNPTVLQCTSTSCELQVGPFQVDTLTGRQAALASQLQVLGALMSDP